MSVTTAAILNILVSLIFAGLIIAVDHFTENSEYNSTARNILIAIWIVPFFWLASRSAQPGQTAETHAVNSKSC